MCYIWRSDLCQEDHLLHISFCSGMGWLEQRQVGLHCHWAPCPRLQFLQGQHKWQYHRTARYWKSILGHWAKMEGLGPGLPSVGGRAWGGTAGGSSLPHKNFPLQMNWMHTVKRSYSISEVILLGFKMISLSDDINVSLSSLNMNVTILPFYKTILTLKLQ